MPSEELSNVQGSQMVILVAYLTIAACPVAYQSLIHLAGTWAR